MPLPDTLKLTVQNRVTGESEIREMTHALSDGVHTVKISCPRGEFTADGETGFQALARAFRACGDFRETAESNAAYVDEYFRDYENPNDLSQPTF